MSGRRIDDHSGFPGKGGSAYPLPEGNRMKRYHSAEGIGHDGHYPDLSEDIHRDQKKNESQARKKPMKSGERY